MHPHDCPGWDYEDHPDHATKLPVRCTELLVDLRSGQLPPILLSCNTKCAHQRLFLELTPKNFNYFAGNYRGADFRCLKSYSVHVPADPRVGIYASGVMPAMQYLSDAIETGIAAIDEAFKLPNAHLPKWQKIVYLVTFSTKILVEFLRVHPYANGNGHMARFIIFALLANYGIWPKKWPLDESPSYHQLISSYRNGNFTPLEDFVLRSVLGQ